MGEELVTSPRAMPTSPHTPITSPLKATAQEQYDRRSMDCPTFLVSEPRHPDELPMIVFHWDGISTIDLDLVRSKSNDSSFTIYWMEGSLGITLGVEETSRRIIVTRSNRSDVRVGSILIRAMGENVNDENFDECMNALIHAHTTTQGIAFELDPPPSPICVKRCSGDLQQAKIDSTFELRFVNDQAIRYLSMEELQLYIQKASKPCTLTFVQRKDSHHLVERTHITHHIGRKQAATALAAAAILLG